MDCDDFQSGNDEDGTRVRWIAMLLHLEKCQECRKFVDDLERTNSMPDASKMTPAEYAAFTGAMSHPVGQKKADAIVEAAQAQARQASDLDYVGRFLRHLEDPDIRLVTEKSHDWTCWSDSGKAAILAVVREGLAAIQARAAVVEPELMPVCKCGKAATCLLYGSHVCKSCFDEAPL